MPAVKENNILINRYKSDIFGEKGATVIEMTLDTATRANVAEMHFVIKEGRKASVSLARGTQEGMVELTRAFIERYQPARLINQVDDTQELKAMYRCGLRVIHPEPIKMLRDTLVHLNRYGSIPMVIEFNVEK